MTTSSLALIGLGPRGISTLERLIAQARATTDHPDKLVIHLIDDAQHGGGPIWDVTQPKELCMNTFSHGMTLFAEPGSTVQAPVVEGPTVYEWVKLLVNDRSVAPASHATYVDTHPVDSKTLAEITEKFPPAELEALRPESYLPRALYGYYLRWFFQSVCRDAPKWVDLQEHHARATRISESADTDAITLSTGEILHAHATIVVTGWSTQGYTEQEKWIIKTIKAHPSLKWIRAGNPIDQGIERIEAKENVLARGLGMGFFDVAILTTEGRGGRFVPDETQPWGLRYEATGEEPTFFVSSRRGYPFLPQSLENQLPQPAPIPRLKKVIEELTGRSGRASIDYDVEVWPAVAKDAYQEYVDTLARVEPQALRSPLEEIIADIDKAEVNAKAVFNGLNSLDEVIARHTTKRFSLLTWIHVLPQAFDSPAELDAYVTERITADLQEALKGKDSPIRAALWSVGTSRKPTQILGAEGRYTIESRHHMFDKAIALGQMTCSGPPVFRTQQLLALVEAGIIHFVGGYPLLDTDRTTENWTMSSQSSGGHRFKGTTLLDAWVHKTDVRRTSPDPFVQSLQQRLTPFCDITHDAVEIPTASPLQDPDTRQVIGPDGNKDARLHLVGIYAHEQYPDTTLSPPIPGTDPWLIQETDKAAVSALRQAL